MDTRLLWVHTVTMYGAICCHSNHTILDVTTPRLTCTLCGVEDLCCELLPPDGREEELAGPAPRGLLGGRPIGMVKLVDTVLPPPLPPVWNTRIYPLHTARWQNTINNKLLQNWREGRMANDNMYHCKQGFLSYFMKMSGNHGNPMTVTMVTQWR